MRDHSVKSPDYLVSICLTHEGDTGPECTAIAALAASAQQALQYWEIVYVIAESDRLAISESAKMFSEIKNLRILVVRDATNYYLRRMIAVREAIGDVVVLTAFGELERADVFAFAAEAMAKSCVVLGRATEPAGWAQQSSYRLIGLCASHRINGHDLKTIALPRNHLVSLLNRPSVTIDLRFEPKHGLVSYARKELDLKNAHGEASLQQRLVLLAEIISTSATRFLWMFALISAAVFVLAVSYGIYAVAVILMLDTVQQGWFTTAIAQSGTTAFLSLGLAAIALGIANIIDRLDGGRRHDILDEIGNITFFDHAHELNVDNGSGPIARKADA